jgi:hypothetical protein
MKSNQLFDIEDQLKSISDKFSGSLEFINNFKDLNKIEFDDDSINYLDQKLSDIFFQEDYTLSNRFYDNPIGNDFTPISITLTYLTLISAFTGSNLDFQVRVGNELKPVQSNLYSCVIEASASGKSNLISMLNKYCNTANKRAIDINNQNRENNNKPKEIELRIMSQQYESMSLTVNTLANAPKELANKLIPPVGLFRICKVIIHDELGSMIKLMMDPANPFGALLKTLADGSGHTGSGLNNGYYTQFESSCVNLFGATQSMDSLKPYFKDGFVPRFLFANLKIPKGYVTVNSTIVENEKLTKTMKNLEDYHLTDVRPILRVRMDDNHLYAVYAAVVENWRENHIESGSRKTIVGKSLAKACKVAVNLFLFDVFSEKNIEELLRQPGKITVENNVPAINLVMPLKYIEEALEIVGNTNYCLHELWSNSNINVDMSEESEKQRRTKLDKLNSVWEWMGNSIVSKTDLYNKIRQIPGVRTEKHPDKSVKKQIDQGFIEVVETDPNNGRATKYKKTQLGCQKYDLNQARQATRKGGFRNA